MRVLWLQRSDIITLGLARKENKRQKEKINRRMQVKEFGEWFSSGFCVLGLPGPKNELVTAGGLLGSNVFTDICLLS